MPKKMNTIEITSTEQLLCELPRTHFGCGHWYFRGVKKSIYELIPSLGRQNKFRDAATEEHKNQIEESMIADFKARSRSLLSCTPESHWEWLALAQHHRLPTRLLDWSSSLLTGLYFACEKDLQHDGTFGEYTSTNSALYALHCEKFISIEDMCENPFDCDEIGLIATAQVTNRMSGQSGLFSIQNDPCKPFDELFTTGVEDNQKRWVHKLEIPIPVREDLFKILHRIGVRNASIFPDLDGLSKEIRQKQEHGCSQMGPIPKKR